MAHILAALAAYFAALVATPIVRAVAARFGVLDRPDARRKRHAYATALLGGAAVFAAAAVGIVAARALGIVPGVHIKEKYLVGIGIAASLLVIGGILDDRFNLSPARQVVWPALAAGVIIASGIGIESVTNPFGGLLSLAAPTYTVFWWQGIPYKLTVLADVFTFIWLMGMTYTTKLLDGLDGLVSGVAAIGCLVIAAVSISRDAAQPDTAALALVIAAAFLGFLRFNRHPATIFLGEGGSTLAGFLLGVLAIISGGKIATTLLVLGLPMFDAAIVIARRVARGASPLRGGRDHLHHRLADAGFSPRQIVLMYYLVASAFGSLTLILDGAAKRAAIALAFAAVPFASWYAGRRASRIPSPARAPSAPLM